MMAQEIPWQDPEELVEYTDDFGRTRTMKRRELPQGTKLPAELLAPVGTGYIEDEVDE